MAARGSKKELSQRHEEFIARVYDGRRSQSSGAAVTDEGDVRTEEELFECKGKFGMLTGSAPVADTLLAQFTKVADEAYAVDKMPVMALRFYAPGHIMANPEGYVDLTVRLTADDLVRRQLIIQYYALLEGLNGAQAGE